MRKLAFLSLVALLSAASAAQTAVRVTVNSTYRNINAGKPIVPDFAGLGFEAAAERPGNADVSGYFFTPSNTRLIALFQQMGVRNIRLGGGTADGCGTPIPQFKDSAEPAGAPDINNTFEFAQAAAVHVIYTLRMIDHTQCFIPGLAAQDARDAAFIWKHYRANLEAFAFSNETDFHSAHSFCTTAGQCQCSYGQGCTGSAADIVTRDPLIYETAVPGGRPVAGTAFPSYLADWIAFAKTLHNPATGAPGAPLAGPDAGDYTGGGTNFSGVVPPCGNHDFTAPSGWTRMFALCQSGANEFSLPTQHFYAGAGPSVTVNGVTYALTAQQAIDNMLSPQWVNSDQVTVEPYQPAGIPAGSRLTYTGYTWLNNTIPHGTRMTELNDYLYGVEGASNGFASALWALDVMHWWALHGGAGVNFHNNQWIPTDTVVPGNLRAYGRGKKIDCETAGIRGPCDDFVITAKGYGIKAFDLGGHGYPLPLDLRVSAAPARFNLTAYAVASGQDLYLTLINKTQGTNPADTASVTIAPEGLPFATASVSSILLWDGAAGDATRMNATIGGATIPNTGAQWSGAWTPQTPDTGAGVTLSVLPATAIVVRFHAGGHDTGPVAMNQDGALEIFAADRNGHLWHSWQNAPRLNEQPNSSADHWSHWTDDFSASEPQKFTGDIATAKNLDNTLEVFAIVRDGCQTHVVYNQQQLPGGAWKRWTQMGPGSAGIAHLQAAQNADGSLSVFGLDARGNLWTTTENAPGVAWQSWRKLGGPAIHAGYAVVQTLNGRLQLLAVDGRGIVWSIGQTIANTWSAWGQIGAPLGHALRPYLQAVSNRAGSISLFSLDSRGHLWTIAQSSPGELWGKWSELTPPESPMQPGFIAGENADGSFVLLAAGSDGNVYCRKSSDPTAHWINLGSPRRGLDPHLVLANTNDGRLEIFGIDQGASKSVWSNWQSTPGGPWQKQWISLGGINLSFYGGQP